MKRDMRANPILRTDIAPRFIRLGGDPTLLFNGSGELVADIYKGMESGKRPWA